MNLKNLSRFLPGFSRKPRAPKPQPAPASSVAAAATQPPAAPEPIPEPAKPTKPSKMLDDVCAFLARYLHCSPEQRTVLALWVLHTHSFAAARATPYLAIQSARKLAGKSLCLRLLSLLSAHPELTSGYTASTLVHRIHSHPTELPTFLLDESPATVGCRSRARNPKLRAILVSGFQPGIGYSDRSFECTIFSPKAFASLGPLPEALADCSIPIVLQPMRDPEESGMERFDLLTAQQEAQPLVTALQNWSRKNIATLKSAPAFKYKDFPQRLTWRGQDLVEPLLQLADLVGGDYPARARHALPHLFDDPARQQQDIATQLLCDLRDCFKHHGWPDGLSTSLILADLRSLPTRPWDIDGPITDRTLAKMLRPYNIRPRVMRKKESTGGPPTARGYQQKDFVNVWHNLLDNPQLTKSEIPNKNAGCDVVTHARTAQDRVAQPPSAVSVSNSSGAQPPSAASSTNAAAQLQKVNSQEPVSPNKNAPCDAVTHARTSPKTDPAAAEAGRNLSPVPCNLSPALPKLDPRLKGILDDPYNYFRQYPDDEDKAILHQLVTVDHFWPQPADDKMPPHKVFRMEDGTRMPFTPVNREPKTINCFRDFKNERWPVMLEPKERVQVALARFHELRAKAKADLEQKQREAANNREPVSSAVS